MCLGRMRRIRYAELVADAEQRNWKAKVSREKVVFVGMSATWLHMVIQGQNQAKPSKLLQVQLSGLGTGS